MDKMVFEFLSYRPYLLSKLGPAGQRTGSRARACEALGCHATYLSQVLTGKVELSLEHGEGFNRFFNHRAEEADFFILLLLMERAGSTQLKERFQSQISAIQMRRKTLKSRVKEVAEISAEAHERFYNSWLNGGMHALASIPQYKSKQAIAEAAGVSLAKAEEVLDFLEKIGLVVMTDLGFEIGPRHVHLSQDSKFIKKHHTNWRLHAIQSLEEPFPEDLHYSGALSLSFEGAVKIRENLRRAFQESMRIVREAKEEVAYVYNFDFYQIDKLNRSK